MNPSAQLAASEAQAIDARTAALESRVGVQVATAVVGKCDTYNELPWKAFALAASLAAFIVVLADWARPDWISAHATLAAATTILGAGACFAGLAMMVPAIARWLLRDVRREGEVRQYAEAMFYKHELFRTRRRNAVLVLVAVYERKIVILPDTGAQALLRPEQWHDALAPMMPLLRANRVADALLAGLDRLEALFVANGVRSGDGVDELPNAPIEEAGP